MPLVKLEVRNEFRLGDPELYKGALKKDDPKALLEGVAVAGLVGILRQLGDLAEFAADVFHDLHEQVSVTASRGRKIMKRIQNIEAALPLVEKAIKGQTSHIHFSYVSGSEWHPHLGHEQSLLLSSELPRFMMDSYEECRDPPRLYLLDKFDRAGAGACMKKYSDPSYFKRELAALEQQNAENFPSEKKLKKIKRKGSRFRNGEAPLAFYVSRHDSRMRFDSQSIDDLPDLRLNSENLSGSTSFNSRKKENNVEPSDINPSLVPDELEYSQASPSISNNKESGFDASGQHDEPSIDGLDDTSQNESFQEQSIPRSSSVTWDEKTELFKPSSPRSCDDIIVDKMQDPEPLHINSQQLAKEHAKIEVLNQEGVILCMGKAPVPLSGFNHSVEVTSETDNYMDALNTLESETETETEFQTKREVKSISDFSFEGLESETVGTQKLALLDPDSSDVEALNMLETSLNYDSSQIISNLSTSDGSEQVLSCAAESVKNERGISNLSPSDSLGQVLSHAVDYVQAERDALNLGTSDNSGQVLSHAADSVRNEGYVAMDVSSKSNGHLIMEKKVCKGRNDGFSQELTTLPYDADLKASIGHASSCKSVSPSIQLWTNAGLFGVQPSKPPDLGPLSTSINNSACDSTNCAPNFSSNTGNIKTFLNGFDGKTTTLHRPSEKVDDTASTSSAHGNSSSAQLLAGTYREVQASDSLKHPLFYQEKEQNNMSIEQATKVRLQRPLSHQFDETQYIAGNNVGSGASSTATSDSQLQIQHGLSTKGISYSFSDLAQKFLADTLQRKPSLTNANTPISYDLSTASTSKSEERSPLNKDEEMPNKTAVQESYAQFAKERVNGSLRKSSSSSPHYSEQSSPPLEHMKISFHPMNSFDMSKLKLELGNDGLHENNEDFILPSFRLLQGHDDQNSGSESDDDTFCRSCPYSSDDLLSPHSFSNSELWEHDNRNESMDYEFDDTSHRFSSTLASVSGYEQNFNKDISCGSKNFGTEDSRILFEPKPFVDLPDLDSILYLRNQQGDHDFLSNNPIASDVNSSIMPLSPSPAPFPLVQSTLNQSVPLKEESSNSEDDSNHLNDLQTLKCLSKQQEQHAPRTPSISEQDQQQRMSGQQKLRHHGNNKGADNKEGLLHQVRDEAKPILRSANGKELTEREELLHQIRNKSFNLRQTRTTAKTSPLQSNTSATNGNVAAILEKATAIRQAFAGSDEGGDEDNWSDG